MALADIARSIEENINRRGIVKRRAEGWLPKIIGYTGYGSTTAVRVLARAIMADPTEDTDSGALQFDKVPAQMARMSLRDFAQFATEKTGETQRGWRQFFTTQVGFLPVQVTVGSTTISTQTDRNGYVNVLIHEHGLEPGVHQATITPVAGASVQAPIIIVSPEARTGLVSDIDDTIVITWLPRAALAAWNSFVLKTNARQVVPGMPSFYEKLLDNDPHAPVFYLSTGAWNVYETFAQFLKANDYPSGPMLLTDWGPTPTGLFRSGQEHKKTQLRNLLIMFPEIKWYLVGDDGQHDPLIYDELARDHPSRVRGIALRTLNAVEQVLSHGTPEAINPVRRDSDASMCGVPIIRGKDGFELMAEMEHFRKARDDADE